ncbi:hypothetical protein GLOIN_2v1785864 [Rhizophagus irregularis DAOM 181602=DAOM 197198]|uniref:Uncharacterized protein n=1 Tax=Rhizophagus irregularis (strain DAOM 181602 / DAOM 197198 / MUCL 43194) TaxID=747089 RepID=A0A2P4P9D9_RHIID|nr:hypothetical protein GLOIN_2v1785864 [Rhizophagus irregularis DAOM 181602=DAOM 197198]POG61999.1 hypothetical protein GLOIN_2v1785864 [Rhizophagus irregularis DAOM 181602=DAOM 197198]|eukprot:XP_025168865.1 hypothetical protein GLOIN_2v1785864 [Rhizophagus irregularis DAOM 181602=DAOM 197198]
MTILRGGWYSLCLYFKQHPRGLELDIPYYHHGFAIEMQREQHGKYIKFFHRDDSNNFIR